MQGKRRSYYYAAWRLTPTPQLHLLLLSVHFFKQAPLLYRLSHCSLCIEYLVPNTFSLFPFRVLLIGIIYSACPIFKGYCILPPEKEWSFQDLFVNDTFTTFHTLASGFYLPPFHLLCYFQDTHFVSSHFSNFSALPQTTLGQYFEMNAWTKDDCLSLQWMH